MIMLLYRRWPFRRVGLNDETHPPILYNNHSTTPHNDHAIHSLPITCLRQQHKQVTTKLRCWNASQRESSVLALLAPPGEHDWMIRQLLVRNMISVHQIWWLSIYIWRQ